MEKYNLKDDLLKADAELMGSNALAGKTSLTVFKYNNSMRSEMFTSHLNQFMCLEHGESPGVFTNAENVVGRHSNGYKAAPNDLRVFRKVVKFEDICEEPTVYKLFVFDEKKQRFDVYERKDAENLVEIFGFSYNNEVIDSLKEGDLVEKGTVLYKSKSYDESMNYSYGLNIPFMYVNDPYTAEDACLCSDWLCEKMESVDMNTVPIGVNHNDVLLNLYGDENNYRPFPELGEYADGVVAVKRTLASDQLLIDFKNSALNQVLDSDTVYYKSGKVIDITVYCNDPEIEETPFNANILKYLRSQTEYYEKIKEVCEEIFDSGYKFTHNVDYLYKRACEFLDEDKRWKNNDSVFSNLFLEITVKKLDGLDVGQKLTGRSGNKSVISKVVPVEEMPFYFDENGVKHTVHLCFNLLGVINRTTGFPLFELSINFICNKVRARMVNLKTLKQKEKLLFDIINEFNEEQAREMYKVYSGLTKEEKEDYINECIEDRIFIHQKPMWETKPIFQRLLDIYEKYDFLDPYDIYINKWGRTIKTLNKCPVGEMYVMKLKQTSKKGFSVRGTGSVNSKGLPERSYKNKVFTERTSSTPIRFGEFESLNFTIAMIPEDIQLFNMLHRTCAKARRELGERILTTSVDDDTEFKISAKYTNRVAEIFSVILKSLSLELSFIDEDDELVEIDDSSIKAHALGEATYFCTDWEFLLIERMKDIEKEILSKMTVVDGDLLRTLTYEALHNAKHLIGHSPEEIDRIMEAFK